MKSGKGPRKPNAGATSCLDEAAPNSTLPVALSHQIATEQMPNDLGARAPRREEGKEIGDIDESVAGDIGGATGADTPTGE